MVAQRTANSRCKALIYLAVLLLCACSDNEYTVVQLHHLDPNKLTSIIDRQLDGEIEYDISGQSIIFYASEKKLKPTITLLGSLDKAPFIYRLSFSWANKYKRSTVQLPPPVTIQSNAPNRIKLFDLLWQISIEQLNHDQVLLTLLQRKSADKSNQQQIFINDPNGVTLQLTESKEEAQLPERQFILSLNTKERIEHNLLPTGLAVTVSQFD